MIRFGSRGSDLALTQTKTVAEEIQQRTGEEYAIEIIETRGDKNLAQPLAEIGGKGLFTAELESALREGRIDIAVHSLKDLPVEDPEGLIVGAIPLRENPHDVLVFTPDARDPECGTVPLLGESIVGTSSPRRRSSLLALRPDLELRDIRGNVDTRARKVADGDYHATILAAAGLSRLGLETPALERVELPAESFTPAPGQGALGIQCRADDVRVRGLLAAIHDETTAACVAAERDLLFRLGGGCSMPLGALVAKSPDGDGFRMLASLFSESGGSGGVTLDLHAPEPRTLAREAAEELAPFLGEPLEGQKVVLLRPADSGSKFGRALGLAGAEVETVSVSEILPLHDRTAELRPEDLRVIAFTSARAVDRFFEQAAAFGLDLSSSTVFAGGPTTAEAVRRRGLPCRQPAAGAGGRVLAEIIVSALGAAEGAPKVLFPCAENRHPDFETALGEAGHAVDALPVYRTVVLSGVEIPEADHVVFTSPSAVRAFEAGQHGTDHASLLALGQTTADAMTSIGVPPRGVSEAPTARAMVQLIIRLNRALP